MNTKIENAPGVGIVGVACRFNGVEDLTQLRQKWADHDVSRADQKYPGYGVLLAGVSKASYSQFATPPLYRDSINQIQLHLLELAQEALSQAGLQDGSIEAEYTDVIFCTGFGLNRAYENYARLYGKELSAIYTAELDNELNAPIRDRLEQALQRTFSSTSHDKVGEMASTIPARIAAFFKLRGKAFALESLDCGGIESLIAAIESIQQGHAKAVLIVAGQRVESELILEVLVKQGIDITQIGSPFSGAGIGGFGEGFCAIVLRACDKADPGVLAYIETAQSFPIRDGVAEATISESIASISDDSLSYIDVVCNSSQAKFQRLIKGIDEALRATPQKRPCFLGAAQSVTGYTYSMSILTSLIKALLVTYDRQIVPSMSEEQEALPAFKDLSNLSIPRHKLDLTQDNVSAIVTGIGLHGNLFAIKLRNTFPVQEKTKSASSIAIIGMGACFGKAVGVNEYWQYLTKDNNSFSPLSPNQLKTDIYWDDEPGKSGSYYIRQASGFNKEMFACINTRHLHSAYSATQIAALTAATEAVHSIKSSKDKIDKQSFAAIKVLAITASNLTQMDEKELGLKFFQDKFVRIFRQVSEELSLKPIEIENGLNAVENALQKQTQSPTIDQLAASHISRLVAEQFGLQAINIAIEAACAGSLAAIDIATNSLRSGRCDYALVTGVELPVNISDLCLCSSQRMLSSDIIATFTNQATGFTPGDGAGTLILTRLDTAFAEQHLIHGVIKAIAGCTESKSIIAPNSSGQVKSMKRAFIQVDFDPDAIDFVEIHGTGTEIGDQVEVNSIAELYAQSRTRPLPLGALKTRFGHCFAAAGMASVIKTVLAMKYGVCPPNIIRGPLNESLGLSKYNFDPLSTEREWMPLEGQPKRAAINAFGTGGINFHLLLEDYKEQLQ